MEAAREAAAIERDKEQAAAKDAEMVEAGEEPPEEGTRRGYGLILPKPQPAALGEIGEDGEPKPTGEGEEEKKEGEEEEKKEGDEEEKKETDPNAPAEENKDEAAADENQDNEEEKKDEEEEEVKESGGTGAAGEEVKASGEAEADAEG